MSIALLALALVVALGLIAAGLVLYLDNRPEAGPESQDRPCSHP
jgi:hypothetical protein